MDKATTEKYQRLTEPQFSHKHIKTQTHPQKQTHIDTHTKTHIHTTQVIICFSNSVHEHSCYWDRRKDNSPGSTSEYHVNAYLNKYIFDSILEFKYIILSILYFQNCGKL